MKIKPKETYEEYALRRAEQSDKFTTFAMVFSSVCWLLVILIEIIVKIR